MGSCGFCQEQPTDGFWSSWCKDCAMLRRMLVLHEPNKCVGILKRCLIRNEEQISNKIKLELKKQDKEVGDESYIEPPKTRSKTLK